MSMFDLYFVSLFFARMMTLVCLFYNKCIVFISQCFISCEGSELSHSSRERGDIVCNTGCGNSSRLSLSGRKFYSNPSRIQFVRSFASHKGKNIDKNSSLVGSESVSRAREWGNVRKGIERKLFAIPDKHLIIETELYNISMDLQQFVYLDSNIVRRICYEGVESKVNYKLRNDCVSDMLAHLEEVLKQNNWMGNEDTQYAIENFCFNQFDRLGDKDYYLKKFDSLSRLNVELNRYVGGKVEDIERILSSLLGYLEDVQLTKYDGKGLGINPNRAKSVGSNLGVSSVENNVGENENFGVSSKEPNLEEGEIDNDYITYLPVEVSDGLIKEIINVLGIKHLVGACVYIFYITLSYVDASVKDDEFNDEISLTRISSRVGANLVNQYMYKLYCKETDSLSYSDRISYGEWKTKFMEKGNNRYLYSSLFKTSFVIKLVETLDRVGLVRTRYLRSSYKSGKTVLEIVDRDVRAVYGGNHLHSIPYRIPMVVEPKDYGFNLLGGYLLNGVKYENNLIIPSANLKYHSKIGYNNSIYNLVNGVMKVPYKINQELLDFIQDKGNAKYNLLINKFKPHKFEFLSKRTVEQDNSFRSHASEVLMQENILDIVSLYRNFSKIYFPVRLDSRGRLYPEPVFFHYQSNELSKALLLFAKPSVIHKSDLSTINNMKIAGANLFGGAVGKRSEENKIKWFDKNLKDILEYKNGILLSKAKDKLLFIAFCMEYNRMYNAFEVLQLDQYNCYMAIRLDGTCNGFQHLALLTDEFYLYDKLNLTNNSSKSNDFYNYIIHELGNKITSMIESGIHVDENGRNSERGSVEEMVKKVSKSGTYGSYVRLSKVIWDRKDIKQAIMTVPYNVTSRSMNEYITEQLVGVDDYKCSEKVVVPDFEGSDKRSIELKWYGTKRSLDSKINNLDIKLLVVLIREIILHDLVKIRKLHTYLEQIAKIFSKLNLPIVWTLPNGLTIKQYYMKTNTIEISPFTHSKSRITLSIADKNKVSESKQRSALMPNLIHSLDAASLTMLYDRFMKTSSDGLFFSIHDCYAVSPSSVETLKTILACVYTELYVDSKYLLKLDNLFITQLQDCARCEIDRINNKVRSKSFARAMPLLNMNDVITPASYDNQKIKLIGRNMVS